jgi:uncharacterized protein (TIGR02145 family)
MINNPHQMKIYFMAIWIALFLLLFVNGIQAQTATDWDGNIYQTVTIGTQVWMSENLKSLHYSDSTVIDSVWSYNNRDSLAAIYGRLYSWEAAMHGAVSSNSIPSGVQGVCPDGWHLPSSAEWRILINYNGGEMEAGAKLKEVDTIHWDTPNAEATNESGFTALPGGSGGKSVGYNFMGGIGFWLSSYRENDFISRVLMVYNDPLAYLSFDSPESSSGCSVRCLKNASATQITMIDNSEQFSIYPNPATDGIIIRSENSSSMDLSIYGLEGKLVLKKQLKHQENHIDISDLPEGIYAVSIRNSQGIVQKKLIKVL